MEIVNHPLCTTTLGAPSDMLEDCSGLPVAYQIDQHGTWAVSFWKPDADEQAAMNAGGGVALRVRAVGRQHPVVSISAWNAEPLSEAPSPVSVSVASELHREFTEGVVYACARMIELFDQPTMAENILRDSGVNLALGCDEDLVFVRQIERYKNAISVPATEQKKPELAGLTLGAPEISVMAINDLARQHGMPCNSNCEGGGHNYFQFTVKELHKFGHALIAAATAPAAEAPKVTEAQRAAIHAKVLARGDEDHMIAPPVAAPTSPAYGIIDPDYARLYTIIRATAWQYGYAIGMHGSFTRDLDLIAVPWADHVCEPEKLIQVLVGRTGLKGQASNPGTKPHGRKVWTLLLPEFGDPRWVDLSIVPRATSAANPSPTTTKENTDVQA